MTLHRFEYLSQRRAEIDHAVLAGYACGSGEAVYLEERDREVHTYICGVSGTGKSRFLENLLLQDIRKGHPFCLIDPTGYLYRKAREYVAYCIERAEDRGHARGDFAEQYLFLDVADPENPVRLNPLEPQGAESTEEQVDDLLKAIERLFPGTLEEQRRLRNVLRNAFWVLAELNRLPEGARPRLPERWAYPLNLRCAGKLIFVLSDEERLRLVEAIPDTPANEWARDFWRDFAEATRSEQRDFRNSSVNVLQYLIGDSLVRRFFETGRSTLHIPDLLREGRSLICHLPLGENLTGMALLGKFLATKLQRSAYRRPPAERSRAYYVYMDEFHQFVDQEFADAVTNLRQFGLRLINAHQSQSQPPFHTAEGQALLQTIKANSQIKALFRLDRPDAEIMSKELFELSQRKPNFAYEERAHSWSEERSRSLVFSFQVTRGTARSWSRAQSRTLAQTKTMGIGRTFGTNIGQTLTEGFGNSRAAGLARAISRSESSGVTEAYSVQHGISVAIGENWSQLRDLRRGFQLTVGENESFAVQRGFGRSQSESEQRGESDTNCRSTQLTSSQGTSLERGSSGSLGYYDDGRARMTDSSSTGAMENTAKASGEEYSRAISRLQGISRSLEENWGTTSTRGKKRDQGVSFGEGQSIGRGGSRQESTSASLGQSRSLASELSFGETETASDTLSENWEQSFAQSMSVLEQISRTYSEAFQEAVSTTETVGGSEHCDVTEGETVGSSESSGKAFSISEKLIYYTLEGERELLVNKLQTLPRQQCFVSTGALRTILVETPFVEDEHYSCLVEDLPQTLMEAQRRRLSGATYPETMPESAHSPAPPAISQEDSGPEEGDWPFED
ncbi:MAG TPA: hypothetical protein VKM72_23640 [Thermoanaerobaculia bacterium]|nr:hypothetical protein [Thermoanaerobaculia bacterium]